ncbi:MAG TPA: polysaccharide deacetylase family protein [Steroidobacteraceae bacterium]|nr:polysaccharide deacetylase family protein [Steroidobacteraceae bacterium]
MSAQHVYLTFDDGPDPRSTPQILDLLARAQMHATFFAIGEFAQREPALMRSVAAAGHAVGNHTLSHRHPWLMGSRAARAQVRDGAKALSDVLGREPFLYRPPHGRARPCMTDEARLRGERVVMWDRSAIDWGWLGTAPRIAERLARVRAGDIVLMHDGRNQHNRPDQLLEALPGFLRELTRRGLRSVACPAV